MINSVGSGVQVAPRSALTKTEAGDARGALNPEADTVELSEAARNEAPALRETPVRTELVNKVKEEIAAGTYLNEQKLDVAIERLQRYLNG